MAKRNFFVKEDQLDDYQLKVINKKSDKSCIIKGCAGSGKSILALWKAKQIQDEGKGDLLFVVYTKSLRQYMKDGIKQVGLNSTCVESFNRCLGWSKNEETGKLECTGWKKGNYDYIIVDEAQDFSCEDILMMKEHAKKAMLLYGDSAQQLYKFLKDKKTANMDELKIVTGFPDDQLVFNHRLPKKIAAVAEYINSEFDELQDRCTNEGREKPYILKYGSFHEQLDRIMEIIKNRNLEDVGILFSTNDAVKEADSYLKNSGYNVESKVREDIELNFNSSNPKLMTYHSSKGLQFEAVFLPECCDSISTFDSEREKTKKNALYVALTRTYQSLYIMYSSELSSYFDAIPTSLYETSINNTEAEEL
jgi:superfamily I DNA/RNA helicase